MCMMLEKPAFYSLPANYVNSLWLKNSDGFGAYNYETREVYKTLDKTEAENYLLDNHNCRLFIHFRMSTGGHITVDNIHPFKISDDMILFHNGVLHSIMAQGTKSDTSVMCSFFDAFHGETDEVLTEVSAYLEENEAASRFTIINTKTNETHTPKCAHWVRHLTKDGEELLFSNNYAIDFRILYPNQANYKASSGGYKDSWSRAYDAWDEYEDMQLNTQVLEEMLEDRASIRSLVEFINEYPECVANFLRDYYTPVESADPTPLISFKGQVDEDGNPATSMHQARYYADTGALVDDSKPRTITDVKGLIDGVDDVKSA